MTKSELLASVEKHSTDIQKTTCDKAVKLGWVVMQFRQRRDNSQICIFLTHQKEKATMTITPDGKFTKSQSSLIAIPDGFK